MDQNEQLLAGVAQPARVTVSANSLGSPCVGGTLSSSDITDVEVTNAPELSSGGPPSVPSRISVVLVEEAKAGGTPRLECPRDDQDIWLLARVAKPASMTVYDDSLGSPCVGGTLSSSDIAGRLLPVVPAGISFPVGPTYPADPDGPFFAGGPVGPFGTISPSDCHLAGPAGPYVAGALLAQMRRCLRLHLTMLARLAGMLLLALLACLGHCPHLTLTLLARMLQGSLLAQMGRCPRFTLTLMASMLQLALLARLASCSRLRYWWTMVGVRYFRGEDD